MPYYMLVMGKAGLSRGASTYRNTSGWHELTGLARPLSGSGYQYQGRDELKHRVEASMWQEPRASMIADVLGRDRVLPWVAVEQSYGGKADGWWSFFDVSSGGYSAAR